MFLPSNMTLQHGDNGDFVAELQRRLVARDHLSEADVTGHYDGNTVNGVKAFQSLQGLRTDGIAGPETLRRLNGVTFASSSGGSTDSEEEEQASAASRHAEREYMNDLLENIEHDHQIAPTAVTTEDVGQQEEPEQKQEQTQNKEQQQRMQQELVRENVLDMTEQRAASRVDLQLEITRDYIRAASPLDSLMKEPIISPKEDPTPNKELEAHRQPENAVQRDNARQLPTPELSPDGTGTGIPVVQSTIAKKPLSPEMERTERQLPASVRDECKTVGTQLADKGVRDAGIPAGTQPGDLAPDQTPSRGAQQQVGR